MDRASSMAKLLMTYHTTQCHNSDVTGSLATMPMIYQTTWHYNTSQQCVGSSEWAEINELGVTEHVTGGKLIVG